MRLINCTFAVKKKNLSANAWSIFLLILWNLWNSQRSCAFHLSYKEKLILKSMNEFFCNHLWNIEISFSSNILGQQYLKLTVIPIIHDYMWIQIDLFSNFIIVHCYKKFFKRKRKKERKRLRIYKIYASRAPLRDAVTILSNTHYIIFNYDFLWCNFFRIIKFFENNCIIMLTGRLHTFNFNIMKTPIRNWPINPSSFINFTTFRIKHKAYTCIF
jgi:hypothetical protein